MPIRKRRTREHVLEDLSENYLERRVLEAGHLLRRPSRDYGVDVTMFHFSETGEIENGEVRFQLKASDRGKLIRNGLYLSIPVKTADLHYWSMEFHPFILVTYIALEDCAYWLDVDQYVQQNSGSMNFDQNTINVRIPVANRLTTESIGEFRSKSLANINSISGQGERNEKHEN